MLSIFRARRIRVVLVLWLVVLPHLGGTRLWAVEDFVLDGVYEAAIDLPRIYFLLTRRPTDPPLRHKGHFELNYAFLDTGASGIVVSRETVDTMGLRVHSKAKYVDVGIGGEEYFDVTEPLYIGLTGYESKNPYNPRLYSVIGPGRFQVKKSRALLLAEPLDVVGMPVMAGQVVVLNSAATNSLEYFAADIRPPSDPRIPKVDFNIALRFEKFFHLRNPKNIPPLPSTALNPVIDKITIHNNGKSSRGNWLLDTGATISLISTAQAARLGLTDRDGKPLVRPDFSLPLGGIGKMINVPGFEVDALVLGTVSGFDLVFRNARIGVHDIRYFDEDKGKFAVLDGVFASNFLCASARMEGLFPVDISKTVFDKIVIDMRKGLLGFVVSDNYTLKGNKFPRLGL